MASKREEYLRRAEEAEREAEKVKDRDQRESWKRIAEGYRALAKAATD